MYHFAAQEGPRGSAVEKKRSFRLIYEQDPLLMMGNNISVIPSIV